MIKNVPIDSIRPDPDQPRKIFDQAHIEGLAKSLEIEGMINPIEIDENGMIITGECRWRASKFLKWEEVPVNINSSNYPEYERLRHQMAENVHQSGTKESIVMNALDVAKAYAKLFKLKTGKDVVSDTISQTDKYGIIKEIAKEIGVMPQTIGDYLRLLEQPEFVQRDIAKGRPRTYFEQARSIVPEFKEEILKRITKGEFKSRPALVEMMRTIKRAPDLARIQLANKLTTDNASTNRILNGIARLGLALEVIPLKEINRKEQEIIIGQLNWLKSKIESYLLDQLKGGKEKYE